MARRLKYMAASGVVVTGTTKRVIKRVILTSGGAAASVTLRQGGASGTTVGVLKIGANNNSREYNLGPGVVADYVTLAGTGASVLLEIA